MTPNELKKLLFELTGNEYKNHTLAMWRRYDILSTDANGNYNEKDVSKFVDGYIVQPEGTLLSEDATAYLADKLSVIGRSFHTVTLSAKRSEIDPNSGSLITRKSYFHIAALDAYADECIKEHHMKRKSRSDGYKLLMAIIKSGVSGEQIARDTGIDRSSISLARNKKYPGVTAGMYRKLVAAYGERYDR